MDSPDEYTKLITELENMKKKIMLILGSVKVLAKKNAKTVKLLKPNKSGFMKPVEISDSLRALIEIPPGELVARCVVNKKINEYIKHNDLQVPSNRQTFTIDFRLSTVFEVEVGSVVHYFKMQSFLKQHYPKPLITDIVV